MSERSRQCSLLIPEEEMSIFGINLWVTRPIYYHRGCINLLCLKLV